MPHLAWKESEREQLHKKQQKFGGSAVTASTFNLRAVAHSPIPTFVSESHVASGYRVPTSKGL